MPPLKVPPPLTTALQILGALTLFTTTLRLTTHALTHLTPSTLPRYRRASTWAIITGSSSGLGLAYAYELASRGFNIILHGRNHAKLQGIAEEIRAENPGCETKIYVADVLEKRDFEDLKEMLKGLDVGVLVNNIGKNLMARRYTNLHETSQKDVDDTLAGNVTFITNFTRAVLPSLIASQPALILNIGSVVSTFGFPGLSIYCASKGYISLFSQALDLEFKETGRDVKVHYVVVGLVKSGANTREESWSVPSARTVARKTLDCVGRENVTIVPYWLHGAQQWLVGVLPSSMRASSLIKAKREDEQFEAPDKT